MPMVAGIRVPTRATTPDTATLAYDADNRMSSWTKAVSFPTEKSPVSSD
ncbi:MAG: hypothetical protein ACREUU_07815 [Gammaproteobacteria bacterium]